MTSTTMMMPIYVTYIIAMQTVVDFITFVIAVCESYYHMHCLNYSANLLNLCSCQVIVKRQSRCTIAALRMTMTKNVEHFILSFLVILHSVVTVFTSDKDGATEIDVITTIVTTIAACYLCTSNL